MKNNNYRFWTAGLVTTLLASTGAYASESDIVIPDLTTVHFDGLGGVSGVTLMYLGILICFVGAIFGLVQYKQTKALPVHESMAKVSNTIWETCKTYLFTQGKFLAILWLLIAACMVYYFMGLQHKAVSDVVIILLASILGILGSYGVAAVQAMAAGRLTVGHVADHVRARIPVDLPIVDATPDTLREVLLGLLADRAAARAVAAAGQRYAHEQHDGRGSAAVLSGFLGRPLVG